MNILGIKENNIQFEIFEGALHEVANEDGVGAYPISFVLAVLENETYIYPFHFLAKFVEMEEEFIFRNSRQLCEQFIHEVENHGSINIDKWNVYVEKDFNLEEELNHEHELEQLYR